MRDLLYPDATCSLFQMDGLEKPDIVSWLKKKGLHFSRLFPQEIQIFVTTKDTRKKREFLELCRAYCICQHLDFQTLLFTRWAVIFRQTKQKPYHTVIRKDSCNLPTFCSPGWQLFYPDFFGKFSSGDLLLFCSSADKV